MKDVVTYCPCPVKLVDELTVRFPEKLTEGNDFIVVKTPTQNTDRTGSPTLALVRCVAEQDEIDLGSLTALEVLGTYGEVFSDSAKLAKYDSVYDRTPQTYTVEGVEYTHTPPDRFGEFA